MRASPTSVSRDAYDTSKSTIDGGSASTSSSPNVLVQPQLNSSSDSSLRKLPYPSLVTLGHPDMSSLSDANERCERAKRVARVRASSAAITDACQSQCAPLQRRHPRDFEHHEIVDRRGSPEVEHAEALESGEHPLQIDRRHVSVTVSHIERLQVAQTADQVHGRRRDLTLVDAERLEAGADRADHATHVFIEDVAGRQHQLFELESLHPGYGAIRKTPGPGEVQRRQVVEAREIPAQQAVRQLHALQRQLCDAAERPQKCTQRLFLLSLPPNAPRCEKLTVGQAQARHAGRARRMWLSR